MFLCDHIYLEQNTSKNSVFLPKMLNSCQNSQIYPSFYGNDENYTRKCYELLKTDYWTAFSQQLIIVLQDLKFGPNMGLNVPTPLACTLFHSLFCGLTFINDQSMKRQPGPTYDM